DSEQPAVAEIPQAVPSAPPSAADSATADDTQPDVNGATGAVGNKAVEDYEAAQNPPPVTAPNLHSLQEFMSEGSDESPIGLELREDRRKLKSGEQADGLLVVKVRAGSPAADAGLRGYNSTGHTVLEGAAVAAAMVFPPAILAIAVLDQTHVGEFYDMIIGVDGKRVSNFLDFEDQMREAKPGDVVYLSVIRNGTRMQVPVQVPTTASGLNY
ncbi:MAG: PDZ domain-containing protein, partial [Candidatus Binataceae bacterium]